MTVITKCERCWQRLKDEYDALKVGETLGDDAFDDLPGWVAVVDGTAMCRACYNEALDTATEPLLIEHEYIEGHIVQPSECSHTPRATSVLSKEDDGHFHVRETEA